jgi:serine protease
LGEYTLEVNRDGLTDGIYPGQLTISSDVNTVVLKVIMQVSELPLSGDVGHLYVRLVDPETGEIREVEEDVNNGVYNWQINSVPPGQYQLVAFSNADNDNRVCDRGEACGAYLTTDQPAIIEVVEGADVSGLDFQAGFGAAFSSDDDL